MKKAFFFLLISILAQRGSGQQTFESYTRLDGQLRYGDAQNAVIPYGSRGYTLIMPRTADALAGTLIMLDDDRPNLQDTTRKQTVLIAREANARGFAVLYVSTGIPVDLYFDPHSLQVVDTLMKGVFDRYLLPNRNIFFLGAMVSGHRALKYIEYCKKGGSVFNPDIKGVVLSESAIDWVRQWYECQKQVRDHANELAFFEGNFISYLFKENMRDTPVTDINKYIDFSAYSYFDTQMKKPPYFAGLAIRAYTYADTRYWFSAQGRGVYDSNYPDMSGFINEQKLAGNKTAELIVFHSNAGDPIKKDPRPQPTTWELVDKTELMDWVAKQGK
jgi:hypothetical protein